MKNILLALDLKPSDQQLIMQAKSLASKFKSKIWIIHITAPEPDFVGYEVGPEYIRQSRADELRAEHKHLHKIMDDFRQASIDAEGLLIQGPTVEMIEKEVEKLNIDLLIIGSHRHGFLYETFVGHTSIKMIKKLSIPILIVPADE